MTHQTFVAGLLLRNFAARNLLRVCHEFYTHMTRTWAQLVVMAASEDIAVGLKHMRPLKNLAVYNAF